MWECPAAQWVWDLTTEAWRGLGVWPTMHGSCPWLGSIFSLTFPAIPAEVWRMKHMQVLGSKARGVAEVTHQTISPVWRLQVLRGLQIIWWWHHSFREPSRPLSEIAVATFLHQDRLRTTYDALRAVSRWDDNTADARAIVLRITLQVFTDKPRPPPPPYVDKGRVLLFFDGGSRGNPGPGGFGAVLIQVSTDGIGTELTWAGSASFASPSTANNCAEYQSLIWGLAAAARHRVGLVHVVGDSAMILRQMRTNTPPRSAKLPNLCAHARFLADSVGVDLW